MIKENREVYREDLPICYIAEGIGIALMAFGANEPIVTTSMVGLVGGGASLYIIGRTTADSLIKKQLREERSGLEKSAKEQAANASASGDSEVVDEKK
jgi:hypothetical protein